MGGLVSAQRSALFIGDRFVTTEASLQHIFSCEPEHVRVVFEFPQGDVAAVAKQPSQFSRCVAVIERQAPCTIVASTDVAMGVARDDSRLPIIQPVKAHRLLDVAAEWVAPIAAAISLPSFVDVLGAVLALPARAARLALRFPALLGDIVHAKVADWVDVSASATCFLFHSFSHSKICGFRRAENML